MRAASAGRWSSRWRSSRHSPHGRVTTGSSAGDRKSTRLNSSHLVISYAVFCLKKQSEDLQDTSSFTAVAPSDTRAPASPYPAGLHLLKTALPVVAYDTSLVTRDLSLRTALSPA